MNTIRYQSSRNRHGFALPTVLIASVVMFAVLVTAVSALSTTRSALQTSYYTGLAREAAESGAEFAQACLQQNGLTATWTDAKPLRPNTDCNGNLEATCPITTRADRCGVQDNANYRATFEVRKPIDDGFTRELTVTGTLYRLRSTDSQPFQTYEHVSRLNVTQELDAEGDRASKRWWFFGGGGAGLDFGVAGSNVTATEQACGPQSGCYAAEGSTVATDSSGRLLFWTNGRTVWNQDGEIMQNSTGLNANASTTQAAAYFPLGHSGTKYATVTNTAESGRTNEGELHYSVIDMTLDSGKGAVTTKNVELWPGQHDYTSEALAVAPKANGTGYWVITFRPGTTNLIVFEFDNNGPVAGGVREFSSGTAVSQVNPSGMGYGTLSFNRDYTKLLMMAGHHCAGSSACSKRTGFLRMTDFDPGTGTVTNKFAWDHALPTSSFNGAGYSASFSPGGTYVYSTTIYPGRVFRYTVAGATTSAQIKNSEEQIAITNSPSDPDVYQGGGQILPGPDGRMYVANYGHQYVSFITNPDAPTSAGMTMAQRQSAVGWQYNGLQLVSGTTSRYGLPVMATRYSPRVIVF